MPCYRASRWAKNDAEEVKTSNDELWRFPKKLIISKLVGMEGWGVEILSHLPYH